MINDKAKLLPTINAFAHLMKYVSWVFITDTGLRVAFDFPPEKFVTQTPINTYSKYFVTGSWHLITVDECELQFGNKEAIMTTPMMHFSGILHNDGTSYWFMELYKRWRNKPWGESPIQTLAKRLENTMAGEEAGKKIQRR